MRLIALLVVSFFAACAINPGFSSETDSQDQNNNSVDGGTVIDTPSPFATAPVDIPANTAWTVAELRALTLPRNAVVRTVISGTEPVDLPVVLIAFVADPMTGSPGLPYLHLRVDGRHAFWKDMYDVAAGMSGSPVVVDGRLAGALSFSYGGGAPGTAQFIATPFEYMKRAGERSAGRVSGFGDVIGAGELYATGDVSRFFSQAASRGHTSMLSSELFRRASLASNPIPGVADGSTGTLKPGSGIAVNFVRGTLVNAGAIGTVTAVEGSTLWAFGHPLMAAGDILLPYSAAAVTSIISMPFDTFKLTGPVGVPIGAITGDWFPAIRGTVGRTARSFRVETLTRPTGGSDVVHRHDISGMDAWSASEWSAIAGVMAPLDADRQAYARGHVNISVRVSYLETTLPFMKAETLTADYDLAFEASWWALSAFEQAFAADAQGHRKTPVLIKVDMTWDT